MSEITFTVPLVPPSVNMYARHSAGKHYMTAEARAYKDAVCYCRPKMQFPANGTYEVEAVIYRGKGGRGDVDNYAKLILDGLVCSGLIVSDDKITDLILRKRRDIAAPRTVITVRTITQTREASHGKA